MFWYTAALRWCRNFTFLITFGLGGLWQMLYAPSGFHSTQILKEFILISGFWEEMAHTNTYRFLTPPPFPHILLERAQLLLRQVLRI